MQADCGLHPFGPCKRCKLFGFCGSPAQWPFGVDVLAGFDGGLRRLIVRGHPHDHGSLGGIYSGLKAASGERAFTVACDMPFLHREVVRLVVARAGEGDVVLPRVAGQWETMHAAYAKTCLPHIEACLAAGRFKIAGFFDRVRVVEIGADEVARFRAPEIAFMNVNTPEELERARALVGELD